MVTTGQTTSDHSIIKKKLCATLLSMIYYANADETAVIHISSRRHIYNQRRIECPLHDTSANALYLIAQQHWKGTGVPDVQARTRNTLHTTCVGLCGSYRNAKLKTNLK